MLAVSNAKMRTIMLRCGLASSAHMVVTISCYVSTHLALLTASRSKAHHWRVHSRDGWQCAVSRVRSRSAADTLSCYPCLKLSALG